MRALTLTQPWCGLVAAGIKLIENRPRSMIKREDFGVPFAIHASREIDESVYAQIAEIAPELVPYGQTKAAWAPLSRVTSAVIAVATIDRVAVARTCGAVGVDDDGHCKRCGLRPDERAECPPGFFGAMEQTAKHLEPDQRRWFFGPIGYVLRDVRALTTPVPCKGKQGFWRLDEWTEAMVREQLGAAS